MTEIHSIRFTAYHGDSPDSCTSPLPDTDVLAQIFGIPKDPQAIERARDQCIKLLKSKNRRGKFFEIYKFTTVKESNTTLRKDW